MGFGANFTTPGRFLSFDYGFTLAYGVMGKHGARVNVEQGSLGIRKGAYREEPLVQLYGAGAA